MKKIQKIMVAIGAMTVLFLTLAGIFTMTANSSERRLVEQLELELGRRYLDELDYEQAIAVYKAAIEIDPKCEEAYLALAEIYTILGDTEKALEILEEGYNRTDSEAILERQKEIAEQVAKEALPANSQETETQAPEEDKSQSVSDDEEPGNEFHENKISEEALNDILLESVDQPATNFIYDDFDNNGVYEAIAFCGEYYEEDGSYFGTLYFVSQEGVQVIREEDGYWNDGEVYDFGDSKVIAITEYFTTGGLTYFYQVDGCEIIEMEGSGCGEGLYQSEEGMYMTDSQYDACVDGTGHTWNTYYFYWDNGLREYGGTEISVDELKVYSGASEIIKKIDEDGYEITSIYKRENGIMDVNCCDGWNNANVRMVYDNKSVEPLLGLDGSFYEAGIIKSAMIPEIATY